MSKCIITQEETKDLTKGVSLSREGRDLLNQVLELYNKKLETEFVAKALGRAKENTEEIDEDDLTKTFKKLAPKVSKGKMIKLIKTEVPDALEIVKEVAGE